MRIIYIYIYSELGGVTLAKENGSRERLVCQISSVKGRKPQSLPSAI